MENLPATVRLPRPGQPVRPAVGLDGTVFVQVAQDYLYAINTDGTNRWVKFINGIQYGPTIGHDGRVYVPASESILALNPSDGDTIWEYPLPDSPKSVIALGPDSLGDGSKGSGGMFFFVQQKLKWLSSDGNTSWEFPLGDNSADLTIGSDGTVYYKHSNDGSIVAFNPTTKTESWRFTLPSIAGGFPNFSAGIAIGGDGSIYFPVDGRSGTSPRLYALAPNFSDLQIIV